MVILTLLHPEQQTPLQEWRFDSESVIRIGRNPDNQVALDDNQISRYHLDLRQVSPTQWQLVSQGTNGTFINGNRVEQSLLSNGSQFQLARGGPLFKFQLLSTAARTQPVAVQPPPTAQVVTPSVSPMPPAVNLQPATNQGQNITQLQSQIQHLTQERLELQAELEQANLARTQLQAILNALDEQFSPSALTAQQTALTTRLAELQRLQATLQGEVTRLQLLLHNAEKPDVITLTKTEQEDLLSALALGLDNIEKQRLEVISSQQQLQKAMQVLNQLEIHLKANQSLSNQLPAQGTRVDTLISSIRQNLKDLDQEIARVHEVYSLSQAKQFFSF